MTVLFSLRMRAFFSRGGVEGVDVVGFLQRLCVDHGFVTFMVEALQRKSHVPSLVSSDTSSSIYSPSRGKSPIHRNARRIGPDMQRIARHGRTDPIITISYPRDTHSKGRRHHHPAQTTTIRHRGIVVVNVIVILRSRAPHRRLLLTRVLALVNQTPAAIVRVDMRHNIRGIIRRSERSYRRCRRRTGERQFTPHSTAVMMTIAARERPTRRRRREKKRSAERRSHIIKNDTSRRRPRRYGKRCFPPQRRRHFAPTGVRCHPRRVAAPHRRGMTVNWKRVRVGRELHSAFVTVRLRTSHAALASDETLGDGGRRHAWGCSDPGRR